MTLRVAISLLAISLASPAITSGEQAQRGRGYRQRDGGAETAARSGGDHRAGDGRERASGAGNRPAERRAESRTTDRDEAPERYAVPRSSGPRETSSRDNQRSGNGPIVVTRNRPNTYYNAGPVYRGPRYYAPVHYDYWARKYYHWSPIRYAPWSLIYGSIGFSSYGFYGGIGVNPIFYGYPGSYGTYPGYAYGPAPYSPWQVGGYNIGGIRLKIRPRDAQVFVDGAYAGLVDDFDGSFQSLRLEAGAHKIEVHMPGFEDLELDVHVQPGRTVTLSEDLKPRP